MLLMLVLCVDMGSMAKTQVDQKAGKLLRIIIIIIIIMNISIIIYS